MANSQNIKLLPFLTILMLLFEGCIITNTPGFYSGYKKLDEKQRKEIIFPTKDFDICNHKDLRKIYSVTAAQIKKCLSTSDTTVLYFWSTFCSSPHCVSLVAANDYCNQKGYRLFVILEEYSSLNDMDDYNPSNIPLYSVNQKYYKTDYCHWYLNRFQRDLIGKQFSKKQSSGRFYFFHDGKFIKSSATLYESL